MICNHIHWISNPLSNTHVRYNFVCMIFIVFLTIWSFPPNKNRLFLHGLEKYGKGDWKSISRYVVLTRNPTQVASHAQKYFERQEKEDQTKKRKSIFDNSNVDSSVLASKVGHWSFILAKKLTLLRFQFSELKRLDLSVSWLLEWAQSLKLLQSSGPWIWYSTNTVWPVHCTPSTSYYRRTDIVWNLKVSEVFLCTKTIIYMASKVESPEIFDISLSLHTKGMKIILQS